MRVDFIFIIAVYNPKMYAPEEVTRSAQALHHRYTTRPEHAMDPARICWIEVETKDEKWKDPTYKTKNAPQLGQRIGIYLVGHGYVSQVPTTFGGKLTAKGAFDIFGSIAELKDRKADVKKLALIACSLSTAYLTEIDKRPPEQEHLRSFLERLCLLMQSDGYRCLAAGWSDYVSTCCTGTGTVVVYDEDGHQIEPRPTDTGRKIVKKLLPSDQTSRKEVFVTNSIRESQKMCYRLDKTGVIRIPVAAWTNSSKMT